MLLHALVCDMENGQTSALKRKESMSLYENIPRISVIECECEKEETETGKNRRTNSTELALVEVSSKEMIPDIRKKMQILYLQLKILAIIF